MKETHYKLKHRVTALFAAAVMLCSMLPGAAFAEEPTPQPTEETVQMEQQTEPSETDNGQTDESSPDPGEDVTEATPETAEEQPAEEEISAAVVGAELYTDLPDAPIGSYIGSEGLPVATGETKIGISEWPESQLEEGGSYLTAVALDNDGLTMAAPLLDGADYADRGNERCPRGHTDTYPRQHADPGPYSAAHAEHDPSADTRARCTHCNTHAAADDS